MIKISSNLIRFSKSTKFQLSPYTTQHQWHKPHGFETGIQVYNSQTRSKQPLILRNKDIATWYTCGPTVYDSTHLGHASCYVKLDILQQILRRYFNIPILTAMNITDIDDKIIKRSRDENKSWTEISSFYESEFWGVMEKLHIPPPDVKIRVTDHIPEIVDFIQILIKKGLAYTANDGSVYFKLDSYPNYGKLQKLSKPETDVVHENKISNVDFALWKARKDSKEPSWPSPWGNGRPGWHIECSVLASLVFGNCLDFHAGGLDLRFPHHENEEAQSCAFHSQPQWVNYWLHAGQLHVKGQAEKMSKSLKNTISVETMLETHSSESFRMACVLSNYRNSMEYSEEMMQTAKNTLNKFISFRSDCQSYLEGKKRCSNDFRLEDIFSKLSETKQSVDSALRDDFDTAKSIGALSSLTTLVSRSINSSSPSPETDRYSASYVDAVGAVDKFTSGLMETFGFSSNSIQRSTSGGIDSEALLDDIVTLRQSIREKAIASKNPELFKICDDIRNNLSSKGVEVKDHKTSSSWNFKL